MTTGVPEEAPLLDVGRTGLRCNLKFAAFVVLALPLLLALGAWQLWRAEEKSVELARAAAQLATGPVALQDLARSPGPLDGRRVALYGHYVPEHAFLLDNRLFGGRVGYELLMPFREDNGAIAIVNRGWLPAPPTRAELPIFDTPPGPIRLEGEVYVPSRAPGPALPADGWPKVVQSADVPALARLAGIEAFAHLVRLAPGQPGVTEAHWPRVNMPPERHRAYALQWFLMALALLAVFLLGGTNLRDWWAERRQATRRPPP